MGLNSLTVNTAKLQADVGKALVVAGKALETAGKKYVKISHMKVTYASTHTARGCKIPRKNKSKKVSKKGRKTKKR